MDFPDLDESAWERGKADAGGAYRSAAFGIAITVISILTGGIAAALSFGGESEEVVVTSVLAGLGGLVLCLLVVLLFQAASAPVRQRNDLRRAWRGSDQLDDAQVRVALADFARRGDDLLGECKSVGYTSAHEAELEEWTREVVEFLSRYRGQESARDLALASKGSGTFVARLEKRLTTLEAIIASDQPAAGTQVS